MRFVVLLAVSAGVALLGGRLLRLGARTGAAPERVLGLALLLAAAGAALLPFAASGVASPAASRALLFATQAGMSGAVALLCRFAWLVFRADSRLARVAAPLGIAANLAALPLLWLDGAPTPTGPLALAVLLPRCAVLGWLFVESAAYARSMRRRVRLGLAEPLVANRFVLWAIWTGALAVIPLFVLGMRVLGVLAAPVPGEPLAPVWRAVFAAIAGGFGLALGAGWLAFFPPAAYRRWLEAGAPSARSAH